MNATFAPKSLHYEYEKVLQRITRIIDDKSYNTDIITSALFFRSIKDISRNPNVRLDNYFSNTLTNTVKPFDQEKTGTCWLQAGLTALCICAQKHSIKFRPSITYLMFFDKLEKAGVFMKRFSQADIHQDDNVHLRTLLLDNPINDGGTWSMFEHLISTYGIVDESSFPETFQAKNTYYLNYVINQYLRMNSTKFQKDNIEMHLNKILEILLKSLSTPPKVVKMNSSNNGINFTGTPLEFFSELYFDFNDYVSLIHAPNKLERQSYCIYPSNDASNLRQHRFYTIELEELKAICAATIEQDLPVWFTANVAGRADFDRKLMECYSIDYELLFGIRDETILGEGITSEKVKMHKMEQRCISPNHAMLFTGIHKEDGRISRWKVQNSWGGEHADLVMSTAWFDENVFEIVVPKKNCAHILKDMTGPAIDLDAWDIIGDVAHAH